MLKEINLEVTKENLIVVKERQREIEQEVRSRYLSGEYKTHIAKDLSARVGYKIPVYEITKIVTGRKENVEDLFFYKKYKRIASSIYWSHKLKSKKYSDLAKKHNITVWLAKELSKCFSKRLNENLQLPKN